MLRLIISVGFALGLVAIGFATLIEEKDVYKRLFIEWPRTELLPVKFASQDVEESGLMPFCVAGRAVFYAAPNIEVDPARPFRNRLFNRRVVSHVEIERLLRKDCYASESIGKHVLRDLRCAIFILFFHHRLPPILWCDSAVAENRIRIVNQLDVGRGEISKVLDRDLILPKKRSHFLVVWPRGNLVPVELRDFGFEYCNPWPLCNRELIASGVESLLGSDSNLFVVLYDLRLVLIHRTSQPVYIPNDVSDLFVGMSAAFSDHAQLNDCGARIKQGSERYQNASCNHSLISNCGLFPTLPKLHVFLLLSCLGIAFVGVLGFMVTLYSPPNKLGTFLATEFAWALLSISSVIGFYAVLFLT